MCNGGVTCLSKDVPFDFTKECFCTFLKLKRALISTPMMQAPEWELPFEVMYDASDFALGVVLEQQWDNKPYVIHYVSCTLNEALINCANEKGILSVCVSLGKVPILFDQFQGDCFYRPCRYKAPHKEI